MRSSWIVKLLSAILILALFSGCADKKRISTEVTGTRTFVPYGLFDENQKKNPNIEYEISVGNIVWSIILFETIIAPVVIYGWYLWEPIGPKITNDNMKGIK